jgi:hypothetical protein
MRYALERMKALFVRERIVFVPVTLRQDEPTIAQQEETVEGIAIVVAAYRSKLLALGLPERLVNDMTMDLHQTLTGGTQETGLWDE